VPAGTQTVVSTISVCNLTAGEISFRIAIRPAGETLATKHYIAYDINVGASDSTTLTLGLTLSPTDVITVYAENSSLSFSVFGSTVDI
jgi:hypothetical protein